jgi:septum formation protein
MSPSGQARLVLASRSPRRVQILEMLGFAFEARSPHFEEIVPQGMAAAEAPEYLARGKALSLPSPGEEVLVLGSDTVVILDGRMMGKPSGPGEALEMLTALNGRTHTVITGVALARNGRILESGAASTSVTFARTGPEELGAYARSGEPLDKAGSYAIQGRGAALVEKVDGCFYNVMGLPVQLTLRLLAPHFKATRAEAK